ncbi:methionine/alanine import family NSS transporter small subunit [Blastococcus sp. SYSU D00820]
MARRNAPGRAATRLRPCGATARDCGSGRPGPARGRAPMSGSAIVMMLVAMAVIWGGLVLAIVSLIRHGAVEGRSEEPPRRPPAARPASR